jgi:hypothetical protein
MEQPMKYKTAINIDLSFPAGGDKGPKRNIGIITPGIMSKNPDHPLMLSPSARIMATTKNPIHVIGSKHPVAFWNRASINESIINKYKNIPPDPCKSKILFIFVVTNSINGRHHCPKNVGLFLCPAQYGSGVLLSEGESPHSPVEGLVSRKGTAAFYLVPKLKIDAMTSISTRATGTSPAISAKSITYSSTLTGDMTISRRELYCSNLSYQNQLNQDEERRVS